MKKVSRRHFLRKSAGMLAGSMLGLGSLNAANAFGQSKPSQKPNFVFLFADDLGWGDLGCYGGRLKTPSLDKLARQGTRFSQFYVCGSVCSPSRAAIMTSHYPARHGVHGYFAETSLNDKRGMPHYLDTETTTVADLLSQNGYRTGHFGKWHLGYDTLKNKPELQEKCSLDHYGFDEYQLSNDQWNIWSPQNRPVSTKMVLDRTFEFVEKNKDRPFYAQAWFADPHAPLNPSDEQMDEYNSSIYFNPRGTEHRSTWEIYGGTVTEMDRQIGIFIDKLDKLGLAENTYVIFSSDNGPEDIHICNATHSGVGSPGPFRGRKRSIYEGGIRVPFIVRCPGTVPAGKLNETSVVAAVDYMPTICSLAGVNVPAGVKSDGQDMSKAILGEAMMRTRPLMWEWRYSVAGYRFHCPPMLAIRDGKWKLLMNPDGSRIELYDIPADPMELNNQADRYPEVTSSLSKMVLAWQTELPESPLHPAAGKNDYTWPQDYTQKKGKK